METAEQTLTLHNNTKARRLAQVPLKRRKLYLRVLNGHASPREAIKAMCLECVGWQEKEVALCTAPACPLYRFRPLKAAHTILPKFENPTDPADAPKAALGRLATLKALDPTTN